MLVCSMLSVSPVLQISPSHDAEGFAGTRRVA
jgi:hypothetical protein